MLQDTRRCQHPAYGIRAYDSLLAESAASNAATTERAGRWITLEMIKWYTRSSRGLAIVVSIEGKVRFAIIEMLS
jgi:hypothetical protein